MPSPTARAAAVFVAATWLLASCSFNVSVGDSESFGELSVRLIDGELTNQIGLGPLDVSCDERAEEDLVAGDSFSCVGTTADGEQINLTSTVDAEGNGVDIGTDNVVLGSAMPQVEQTAVAALEESVGQALGNENFTCGDTSVVLDAGEAIPCVLTDPVSGAEYDASVFVTDFDSLAINVEVDSEPRS